MLKGKKESDVAQACDGSIGKGYGLPTGGPTSLKEDVLVDVEEEQPDDSGFNDFKENSECSEDDSAEEEESRKIEHAIHTGNVPDFKSSDIAQQALVDANVKDLSVPDRSSGVINQSQ